MAEETHPQTPVSNPALARLQAFVGTWQWEASREGKPIGRGPTVFAGQDGGPPSSSSAPEEHRQMRMPVLDSWELPRTHVSIEEERTYATRRVFDQPGCQRH